MEESFPALAAGRPDALRKHARCFCNTSCDSPLHVFFGSPRGFEAARHPAANSWTTPCGTNQALHGMCHVEQS